jgi:hypothetical protein
MQPCASCRAHTIRLRKLGATIVCADGRREPFKWLKRQLQSIRPTG